MTMKKTVSLLAAALVAFVSLGGAHAEENPKVIRIAFSGAGVGGKPGSGSSYIATAHQQGVFEKEFEKDGIKIEWSFFVGAGPATNEALALKKVDFASQGDLPLIVARSTGLRTKIILKSAQFSKNYLVVPSGTPYKSIEDLKGKKVTVQKGTATQLLLNRVLEQHGMKEDDLRVIDMNSDSQKAALSTGDVDSSLQSGTDLVARGLIRRILKIDDPTVNAPSFIWVTEEFEQKYPHLVQRFVNALLKVAAWSADEKNRNEQFRLWAKSGNPFGDYKEDFQGDSLRDRLNPLLDEYFVSMLNKSIGETKKFRFTRRDVSTDGWIEPKYLNAGLKELKLEGFWDEFDANAKRKTKAK
jgi:sulfonate transport system substrate-binding protein